MQTLHKQPAALGPHHQPWKKKIYFTGSSSQSKETFFFQLEDLHGSKHRQVFLRRDTGAITTFNNMTEYVCILITFNMTEYVCILITTSNNTTKYACIHTHAQFTVFPISLNTVSVVLIYTLEFFY